MISNAASVQLRQALNKQLAAEKMVADIDAKTTKEKTNDLAENERLRGVVAVGERRLRIAGNWSVGSSNVSGAALGSSMGNAATIELSGEAGQTIFDIRAEIIADQAALKTLQAYALVRHQN